jgi:hypothetical protein
MQPEYRDILNKYRGKTQTQIYELLLASYSTPEKIKLLVDDVDDFRQVLAAQSILEFNAANDAAFIYDNNLVEEYLTQPRRTMKYKGYVGKVEFDDETRIFHGEIINIRDTITFQESTIPELYSAFYKSIDDYFMFCEQRGETPNMPMPIEEQDNEWT